MEPIRLPRPFAFERFLVVGYNPRRNTLMAVHGRWEDDGRMVQADFEELPFDLKVALIRLNAKGERVPGPKDFNLALAKAQDQALPLLQNLG